MAELYNVDRSVITKYLGNIFSEGELQEDSVSAFFAHTAEDGKAAARAGMDAALEAQGIRVDRAQGVIADRQRFGVGHRRAIG